MPHYDEKTMLFPRELKYILSKKWESQVPGAKRYLVKLVEGHSSCTDGPVKAVQLLSKEGPVWDCYEELKKYATSHRVTTEEKWQGWNKFAWAFYISDFENQPEFPKFREQLDECRRN